MVTESQITLMVATGFAVVMSWLVVRKRMYYKEYTDEYWQAWWEFKTKHSNFDGITSWWMNQADSSSTTHTNSTSISAPSLVSDHNGDNNNNNNNNNHNNNDINNITNNDSHPMSKENLRGSFLPHRTARDLSALPILEEASKESTPKENHDMKTGIENEKSESNSGKLDIPLPWKTDAKGGLSVDTSTTLSDSHSPANNMRFSARMYLSVEIKPEHYVPEKAAVHREEGIASSKKKGALENITREVVEKSRSIVYRSHNCRRASEAFQFFIRLLDKYLTRTKQSSYLNDSGKTPDTSPNKTTRLGSSSQQSLWSLEGDVICWIVPNDHRLQSAVVNYEGQITEMTESLQQPISSNGKNPIEIAHNSLQLLTSSSTSRILLNSGNDHNNSNPMLINNNSGTGDLSAVASSNIVLQPLDRSPFFSFSHLSMKGFTNTNHHIENAMLRILVPCCGSTYDLVSMENHIVQAYPQIKAFKIIGVELSRLAILNFLQRENIAYVTLDHSYNFNCDPKSRRSLPVYETQHLTLVNASIFDETIIQYLGENSIDLIYDVDAFSVINPSERQAYVDVLFRLLKKPRGRILLHCYDYPIPLAFTHPYPIGRAKVTQLFEHWCHYRRIYHQNADSLFIATIDNTIDPNTSLSSIEEKNEDKKESYKQKPNKNKEQTNSIGLLQSLTSLFTQNISSLTSEEIMVKRKDIKDTLSIPLSQFATDEHKKPNLKAFIDIWVMSAK